jgi:cyclophilin family peptidyl-prolyl cis-trans isomerase
MMTLRSRTARLLLPLLVAAGCATTTEPVGPRVVRLTPADGGPGLAMAVGVAGSLSTADRPVHIELAPGRYVLAPTAYTDPACGNCQDATEQVPTTVGLRVSGTRISITGAAADSVVIHTGAGYGVLFDGCDDCVLRDVTVTGGERSADGRATDAAVVVRESTVTLDACVLRDNIGDSATVSGVVVGIAGIAIREAAHVTVSNCRILRNSWDGIAMYRGARAHIADNVVDGIDKAAGARVGGGRGVGIGLTWDAEAVVERNLVRRYWKGIGAFVEANADIRENVVEDILTWGIALWGPDGSQPSARIERNIVYRTGACGVMIERPAGGRSPGTLVDNLVLRTGGNDVYDRGEPYCWQRPIARHGVPAEFVERNNLLAANRQPRDAGAAPAPLPELPLDSVQRRAGGLLSRLATHPALAGALVFSELSDRTEALATVAREWSRLLAAEDGRAGTDADLAVLLDGLRAAAPELRAAAVRGSGRLEREALVDAIAPLLGDPAPRVRAAAAAAIAQSVHGRESARARERLSAALPAGDEDPIVIAAMAEALGRLRHADEAAARETLRLLLPHVIGTNDTRLGVLRGLYFLARQPAARGVFDAAAHDALRRQVIVRSYTAANDARSRGLAVATLAAAGGIDSAVIDSVLTRDTSPFVRREAVAAAGTLREPEAVRAVVQRALADSAAVVRLEALRLHGRRLAASGGCDVLVAAAADAERVVALLAIDQIGSSCAGDTAAGAVLRATVAASDRLAGARALAALAAVEPAAARRHLAQYAADSSVFVRMHAARAAALLNDGALLRRLASDPQPNVRTVAVTALARTMDSADPLFAAQLAEDDSELLMAAAAALGKRSDARAAGALLDALDRVSAQQQQTSRDGRLALLRAAQAAGSAQLVARVQPYLRDFDPVMAASAADVIEAWTGTRPAPAPQPLRAPPVPTFDDLARLERQRFVIELETGAHIVLRLHGFDAPTNAARFARLAESGYYDGLTFHRIVPNFVVQGGSPRANEHSGDGPFTRDEVGLANWRGTVGLSTRGRDTGDAQFYINLIDNVRLDHEYTVFGEVIDGMDAVDGLVEGTRIRRIRAR